MSLRSLRVELEIERGGTVRLDRQLPFLGTQNRMAGFHAVGTGRKLPDGKCAGRVRQSIVGVVDRIPPILHVGMHTALHREDLTPFPKCTHRGPSLSAKSGCRTIRPRWSRHKPNINATQDLEGTVSCPFAPPRNEGETAHLSIDPVGTRKGERLSRLAPLPRR